MNIDINQVIEFTKFFHKFQQTHRLIYVTGEDRKENDAEHSYQLAFTAWYLVTVYGYPFNLEKIFKYAIGHDLVETYAGDTYFDVDEATHDQKRLNESQALERIKKEFPEFTEMHQIIEEYEAKADPESRFISALDKVIPVINIMLDGGRTWADDKMRYEVLVSNKDEKVKISPEGEALWLAFKEQLDRGLFFQG